MTPKLATGLEIARAAEEYELEAQFVVALEKYQVGGETMSVQLYYRVLHLLSDLKWAELDVPPCCQNA